MRQDTRSAWADPTLTSPAPKRRSRTFNVVLGVLLTIVAAGIADVVVVWSCALVYDTRLGAALLGCLGALVLSHVWASRRAQVRTHPRVHGHPHHTQQDQSA